MSEQLIVVLGLLVWGTVFVCLLAAMAIEADVERRWDEAWALDWEKRHGASIDELIERLAQQARRWRLAKRLLSMYLVVGLVALVVLGVFQYQRWLTLSPDAFRGAMLFGVALIGLLLLPFRVVCEIGLGLVEGMHRQVRNAVGERVVISSRQEIDEIPKPTKGKEKEKAKEPEPARK